MSALLAEDWPATCAQRSLIVSRLRAEGLEVEELCAAGDPVPTPYTVAHRFTRHGYRLTFRVLEPDWVLLTMYERLVEKPRMADAFTCMTGFVDWLRRQEIGIEYVLGRVETALFRKGRDLDDDRLLRYYLAFCGAEVIALDDVPGMTKMERMKATLRGIRFVRVGVPGFRMPKERARAMRGCATAGRQR